MTPTQIAALVDAMQHLLDDMGTSGLSVAPLSKARARIAFEPFRDPGDTELMPLDEAVRIVREADEARSPRTHFVFHPKPDNTLHQHRRSAHPHTRAGRIAGNIDGEMTMAGCNCTGACRMPPYRCSGQTAQLPLNPWPQPGDQFPPQPPTHPPFLNPFPILSPVVGCICPPGANRDCENPTCPRKGPKNMKSTNVATAAASGGVAGELVVIICWALGLAHVEVPAEVAASLMVVATPVLHLVALRLGVEPAAAATTAPTGPAGA